MDAQDVAGIKDPGERALAVNQLIDEYQAAITELSDLRRETLRELLASGMPQMAIADLLGISKSRVSQLLSAGSRPERAFLGTGTVTVAVGGKLEAGKAEPGAVVSSESFGGYEVLASLAPRSRPGCHVRGSPAAWIRPPEQGQPHRDGGTAAAAVPRPGPGGRLPPRLPPR